MPLTIIAMGPKGKGKPSMPPPEMPKGPKAKGRARLVIGAAPPARTGPPKPPERETEAEEARTHDMGEKFSADRLIFFDGSETCSSCHHFDTEAGECKIGAVTITDPDTQGCHAGYDSAEEKEAAYEREPGENEGQEEVA
jgi:hypothetical protein